ncbi:transposase [Streptococcus pneumoniae]|nr:transposase [Streptococcus pneumoniae]
MLYVGIDIAKNKHDVTALNVPGKTVLKPLTFSNNKAGFELLDLSLRQLNQDCLIALENTGHYAFNLLNFLHEQGYKVYTYTPLLIKEFAKSLSLRKTKTNKKDAHGIALKLLSDPNREQFQHDNRQVELKILTRHIHRLKKKQSDWKVQYTRCLDIIFPELDKIVGKHSEYTYQLLTRYPNPQKRIEAGFDKLIEIKRLTASKIQDILSVAPRSIGTTSPAREFEIIKHYKRLIDKAETCVNDLMAEFNSVITTVTGIGNRLEAVILAEIRNIHAFDNREQFQHDNRQVELKILTRHIHRLKKKQSDWKVQYTRCLDIIFPELDKIVGKHSEYTYQLLTRYPNPQKRIEAGFDKLIEIKRLTASKIQDILSVAPRSIGTTSPAREFEIIKHYKRLIDKAETCVNDLMAEFNSVITTVTGIENRLGAVILAEIRNIHAFDNPAQLQAFAGLDSSIYQSGQIDLAGRMIKRGSPHLRWALIQAAKACPRFSPAFKAYLKTKLE